MKKCKICGKETDRIVKGMCIQHYNKSIYVNKERKKYGKRVHKEIPIIPRTKYGHKPNMYIKYTNYAEIILCDTNGNERMCTKIDLDDIEKCTERGRWSVHSEGYAQTFSYGKFELLHRFIMNAPKGNYVDHINHDILDNRRCNLRIVTPHQSNLNQHLRKDNTSGHKGISWYKRDSKWEVFIFHNNKRIYIGKFKELKDAINARKEAECKYYDTKYIYNSNSKKQLTWRGEF